ncbi:Fucose 4-O-acetylase [Devosia crocina]|uniref:Fucose 4-O-acetylase n=1 Tax=Devosia crocina TaxID=429728 RepID=A0A1I7N1L6_9HYPH|nr:acyltransferase family protein [Devosia crocina]SFV28525.1 Fucose 4-O-acetylase [Devosia crocina]
MIPGGTTRLPWLDCAKGLGIVLVVWGHVLAFSGWPLAEQLKGFIYAFHIPLFFLLAGMTLHGRPIAAFAMRKLTALLLPYLGFLVLLGLPALAVSALHGPVPALGIDRWSILLAKLVLGGSVLSGMFGTFWFVPCLFGGLVLAQAALHMGSPARHIFVGFLVIGAYALPALLPEATMVLGVGSMPMAAVLILVGFWAQRRGALNPLWIALSALVLVPLALLMPPHTDMKFGDFGVPLLGVATAIGLAFATMLLARLGLGVPPLRVVLAFAGHRSLTIMYLHQAVHLGLRLAGVESEPILILLALLVPALLHDAFLSARHRARSLAAPFLPLHARVTGPVP